jgi:polysaccharide deacetylase family protein (PEP-CTERM system associated)
MAQTLIADVAPLTSGGGRRALTAPPQSRARVVLSFDVEEHYRIEAAGGMDVGTHGRAYYRERMEAVTYWLLEQLAARNLSATFYVVGELAQLSKALVRAIADAGHEVGSHGWDHRRVLVMQPEEFRRDARQSKDALEQATGTAVVGYRAPTFSIVRKTSWALGVLAEEGYLYDSSIYPVRHDRYGIPDAPFTPFVVRTHAGPILEIPPLTLRWLWMNWPVGGGGYFRLLPNWLMYRGISRMGRRAGDAPAMLYFHPWEFDPAQLELPLRWLSRLRTYVGIKGSRERLLRLLEAGYAFDRAAEVARRLMAASDSVQEFDLQGAIPERTPA